MTIVMLVETYPCLVVGSWMQHGTMQMRPSICGYIAVLISTAGCLSDVSLADHLLLTATVRIHMSQQLKMVAW